MSFGDIIDYNMDLTEEDIDEEFVVALLLNSINEGNEANPDSSGRSGGGSGGYGAYGK